MAQMFEKRSIVNLTIFSRMTGSCEDTGGRSIRLSGLAVRRETEAWAYNRRDPPHRFEYCGNTRAWIWKRSMAFESTNLPYSSTEKALRYLNFKRVKLSLKSLPDLSAKPCTQHDYFYLPIKWWTLNQVKMGWTNIPLFKYFLADRQSKKFLNLNNK